MRSTRPNQERRRGSDETGGSSEPRFIAIGYIIRPHGVRGEVLVEVLTDYPERFETLDIVYLGNEHEAEARRLQSARWHRDRALLRFEGYEDRTTAEQLRGLLVQVPIEEVMPLGEDEYYPHELIGLDVRTVEGEELGRISEVLFTPANEIYVVEGRRGQILLPAIADVIERVDLEAGNMTVRLMEGLL